MNAERWLSVREIAQHLGVSEDVVYRWIKERGLPAHKIGKLWKFQISEVDQWIKSGTPETEKNSFPSKLKNKV